MSAVAAAPHESRQISHIYRTYIKSAACPLGKQSQKSHCRAWQTPFSPLAGYERTALTQALTKGKLYFSLPYATTFLYRVYLYSMAIY